MPTYFVDVHLFVCQGEYVLYFLNLCSFVSARVHVCACYDACVYISTNIVQFFDGPIYQSDVAASV